MKTSNALVDAEAFKKIHPLEFHKKFLSEKLRPDGRTLTNVRKTVITTGSLQTTEGSSLVKMGNTSVICGIKAEVTIPKQKNPFGTSSSEESTTDDDNERNEGIYVINVEIPSLCSPQFQQWTDSQQETSTLQFHIQNTLEKYNIIDRKELCISPGEAVWVLYIDIFVLEHDGNLFDASFIAALSALDNLKLPAVEIVDGVVKVVEDQEPTRITVAHFPIPLSFAVIDQQVITDPTSDEENLCNARFSIIFNEKGQLCSFYKPGGVPIPQKYQLQDFMSSAKQWALDVYLLIKESNKN